MEELRAARPAHLADGPADPRTREAELAHAFAQPRQVPRRGRKPLVWGLGLATAAAAAVTAVSLAGGQVNAPAPHVASQPVTLSAKEVLLMAATSAESRPASTGKYWHVSSRSCSLIMTDQGFAIAVEQESKSWVGADRQAGSHRQLSVRPATDADRALWEKAGSPLDLTFAGKKQIRISEEPGEEHIGRSADKEIYWIGRNVTFADLQNLPSDPEALKADLLRFDKGEGMEGVEPGNQDAWLFGVTEGLITDMPVTPQVRAAAFRMLAELPSVTSLGRVTDASGRTGTAIAIESAAQRIPNDTRKGVLQVRLIIDEESGRALARESVVVRPGGFAGGLEPGTVSNYNLNLGSYWTDELPG